MYKPSQSFAISALVGTPTPKPLNELSIVSMIIAEQPDIYRIELNTYNPLDRDIFVNRVTLSQFSDGHIYCSGATETHYVLSDSIVVTSKEEQGFKFSVPLFPQDESLSGFQYDAQGSYYHYCTSDRFEVSFESSVILASGKFTAFILDVPKVLTVTQFESFRRTSFGEIEDLVQSSKLGELDITLIPNQLDKMSSKFSNFGVKVELGTNIGLDVSLIKHFVGE